MNRTLRNVVAVVVLTAFTAIAVIATVQATGRIVGTDTATAASASATQTAVQDQSTAAQSTPAQSSPDQSQSTGPYGYDSSVYTPDANGLMYCPATGCAESSCHALQ